MAMSGTAISSCQTARNVRIRSQVCGQKPSRSKAQMPSVAGVAVPSSTVTRSSVGATIVSATLATYACGPYQVFPIREMPMKRPVPTELDPCMIQALSTQSSNCMAVLAGRRPC